MNYIQPSAHLFRQKNSIIIKGPQDIIIANFTSEDMAKKALNNFIYVPVKNEVKTKTLKLILISTLLLLMCFNLLQRNSLFIFPVVFLAPSISKLVYIQIICYAIVQFLVIYLSNKRGLEIQNQFIQELNKFSFNIKYEQVGFKDIKKHFITSYRISDNQILIAQLLISVVYLMIFNVVNTYYADAINYIVIIAISMYSIFKAHNSMNQFGQVISAQSFSQAQQYYNQDIERNVKKIC